MLFLEIALLTLLTAAPDLLVSGENIITCYGNIQHLTCDTGLIQVTSSVYGRIDRHTCNINRPTSEVSNINCAMKISTIAERCNGLRECELKTDLLGNPDPCFGTYKYYNTTYDCINGRLVVICEHGYTTLDCGDDSILIINANYGRADSKTCSNGLPSGLTQKTNCYDDRRALRLVVALCNGRKSCTVEASYTIFTDPCFGTVKYLTVSYMCYPTPREIVTCEGKTAVLNCGARHIKINSANYGRTDSTTCTPGPHSNTNCYLHSTINKVATRCDGKSSCEVPATNNFFSDSCYGTTKYLRVVYSCV